MKTYTQFSEDLKTQAQRSAAIRQATLDKHQQKVSSYKSKIEAQRDKEEEHQEIVKKVKKELQLEQTPVMQPSLFTKIKAREQAKGGIRHRVHVHQELGAEARAQQSAKNARMKAIMSR